MSDKEMTLDELRREIERRDKLLESMKDELATAKKRVEVNDKLVAAYENSRPPQRAGKVVVVDITNWSEHCEPVIQ